MCRSIRSRILRIKRIITGGEAPLPIRGAKAHTQSALPREMCYTRSRWSL